jgi:hypothetical protein
VTVQQAGRPQQGMWASCLRVNTYTWRLVEHSWVVLSCMCGARQPMQWVCDRRQAALHAVGVKWYGQGAIARPGLRLAVDPF